MYWCSNRFRWLINIAVTMQMPKILDAIGEGLTDGTIQAGISISGGEIAQLKDVVNGFDLAGTAVGTVPLDKIITGRSLKPGVIIIGLANNGIAAQTNTGSQVIP